MAARPLLRVLSMPKGVERGLNRLEKSLFELRDDIDAALHAFVVKNQRSEAIRQLPAALRRRVEAAVAHPDRAPVPELEAAREGQSPIEEFDPAVANVCLSAFGDACTIEATPAFWSTIAQRDDLRDVRLVREVACEGEEWHSEMHPYGEEVLVLLSGSATLVVETNGEEKNLPLHAGRACVIPRGVWHRTNAEVPSRLFAITYGRGTEYRALSLPPMSVRQRQP